MTSPARQLGLIRAVPSPAPSPGGVESYKRLADVFHQLLAEQELDTLLEQVAATLGDIVPYDTLTGLFNHRYFHDRLRTELVRTNRSGEPLAVAMLDLDEFKRVNDVHGHGTGDEVLVTFADLLRAEFRASDVVCRVGGEEFGVIMPSCDAAAAVQAVERLHKRLAREPFAPTGPLSI